MVIDVEGYARASGAIIRKQLMDTFGEGLKFVLYILGGIFVLSLLFHLVFAILGLVSLGLGIYWVWLGVQGETTFFVVMGIFAIIFSPMFFWFQKENF